MDKVNSKIACLEKIIALTPGHVYWKDREGRYLGCNNNFAKMVKLPNADAIVGKTDYDFLAKELADVVWHADQNIMSSNQEKVLEELAYDINGDPAIYLSKKVPLHDDEGNVIGILGTSLDITDRKVSEEKLLRTKEALEESDKKKSEIIKSNEFLMQIVDLLPCNVYWKNRKGVYLGCNKSVTKMMSWASTQEIVGKTVYDFADQKIADEIHANDEMIMSNAQEMTFEESGYSADGSYKPAIYFTRKVPLYDDDGKVAGLLGVSLDITERKQMEQALLQAKGQLELSNEAKAHFIQNMSYLESVIAVLPGNIYWKNREGIYLGCNDNGARLVGFSSGKELIGKRLHDFVDKKYADIVEANDERIMNQNREEALEEHAFNDKGEPAIYLTRKTPLRDENGKVVGLLGVSLDISDIKKQEEALREAKEKAESANRAKSDFLAVVSHELRIPLTGILGMAQLIEGDNLYPEQQEQLDDLIKSGEHLLSLINDLLDIAKLEAGKMEIHPAAINLRKIIEEMTTIISHQAKLKGLELLVDYPIDVPSNVIADGKALRHIILNLTGNALKFTEHGHVIVKVDFKEDSISSGNLIISVQDSGIGISADKLDIIFDRFAQVDGSRVRRYGGTGLGLAIAKEYIDAMGGNIEVQSAEGQGSTFTCSIPVELSSLVQAESPWETYRANVRVLIVDDSMRGEVLRRHIGSSVCQAVEGKNALNLLRATQAGRQPFDIVIIDQQLHSIDPSLLCKEIKKQKNMRQPMLLLLAFKLTLPAKTLAKEAGFFDVVIKPVQPIETLISLTAIWERWLMNNNQKKLEKPIRIAENKISVLLVEDEPIIQRVHILMLEKLNCHVDVADLGELALKLFKAKYYNFVFLDIGLPDIDGFEVAKQMRHIEVERGYTPIIGITGYNSDEDKQKCFMSGMDEVAIKPVKPEEFDDILQRWLLKKPK